MSYCIEYNPELKKRYPTTKKRRGRPQFFVVLLLAISVAAYIFIRHNIIRYIIPGDAEVTTAAFSTMVEKIGDGDSVGDAFFAFCRDIVDSDSK